MPHAKKDNLKINNNRLVFLYVVKVIANISLVRLKFSGEPENFFS